MSTSPPPKLATLLASFDEAALGALASVGLVRRAAKDLEKSAAGISVEGTADEGVTVTLADAVVTIPEAGPAGARCSCPAGARCRHVVMAVLYLQKTLSAGTGDGIAEATQPMVGVGPDVELMGYSVEALTKFAGKKVLRDALRLLGATPEVEIAEGAGGGAVVRFTNRNIDVRFFPGGGLAGMVTNAPAKERERVAVAAVLAYQRRHGLALDLGEEATAAQAALGESASPPRSRAEIVASAVGLLEEMVAVGLSHVSPGMRERLTTLAISAVGANLPRLSLTLRGLAEGVRLFLARDAQADAERFFADLARAYALACGLRGDTVPSPHLVGQHRTHYEEVGSLALHGVGAYAWRTASNYSGLTVVFWDQSAKRFNSWSEARPRHLAQGFDPIDRYQQAGPWDGAVSPGHVATHQFKLNRAKRNDFGRLSAAAQTGAVLLSPTRPMEIDFGNRLFTNWQALRAYAGRAYPVGLAARNPHDDIVVLKPSAWGEKSFDAVTQTFTWWATDDVGDVMALELAYSELTQPTIEALEKMDVKNAGAWGVLGRLEFKAAGMAVMPVSMFITAEKATELAVVNPGLDRGLSRRPAASAVTAAVDKDEAEADEEGELESEKPALIPPALETRLAWVEDRLQAVAERGRKSLSGALIDELTEAAREAEAAGLGMLCQGLEALARNRGAGEVVRLKYVLQLHRQVGYRVGVEA
ncbi:MAG: hypothetical protein JWN40_832 [Phycisphaerales bacterium]|nr:hypothetical protein [Phycisphaerales bacterium]